MLQQLSSQYCFGGFQQRYQHYSATLQCDMHFSVFLPPQAATQKVPVLYWLSGLTCTDENFATKAGAQRIAALLGIALVMPDTSPRGPLVPDAPDVAYDLGLGAGFYVNATQEPWQTHYQMYDYVSKELPQLCEFHLPCNDRRAISGHSMGGHGALVIALRQPEVYCSVSAFAPICNPSQAPWGQKAFRAYLGEDPQAWANYDATELLKQKRCDLPILVSQGLKDQFLQQQLLPQQLERVAEQQATQFKIEYVEHYDHSYYFIASFIEQHLRFHAECLHANDEVTSVVR